MGRLTNQKTREMSTWKILLLPTAVGENYTCEVSHPSGYSPDPGGFSGKDLDAYIAARDVYHLPYTKTTASAGVDIWDTGIKRSSAEPRYVDLVAVQIMPGSTPPKTKHTEKVEVASGGGGGSNPKKKSATVLARILTPWDKLPSAVKKRLKTMDK